MRQVTEQRLRRYRVHYGRFSRWADPDIRLVYYINGHRVMYDVEILGGERYDVTTLDGHVLAFDRWKDDAVTGLTGTRASEAFELATGWFPYEFEALCDRLERRGVNCTFDVVEPAVT